jgi:transposase
MAAERLSMRNAREILRQKWELGRSHRQVAESLGVSIGIVSRTERRARRLGLQWATVRGLSDAELESRLYEGHAPRQSTRPRPDPVYIHTERAKPGVTLELLHHEYLEQHPDGYRYTQFCEVYRQWLRCRRLSMRQVHRAGEKLFMDYSGKKPHLVDPHTGEIVEVELFVAVLGASNYTYAEATRTQQVADFISSQVRTFEFLGGVPAVLIPDQLKTAVTHACRYEPAIQRTYQELAEHYGTTVLPARPAHPRDKAKAEVSVQIVQRCILARLRHQVFFSLAALNARIAELLLELNRRPMRLYRASRLELFERLDRPALKPLPAERFEVAEWKRARVNIDYHVELDGHYYSVHHSLLHEAVELRVTATTVEIFLHHGARAHAQGASAPQRVDAVTTHSLGRHNRSADRRSGGGHPERSPTPRTGLPLLSGHPPPRQALRARAAGGGVRPGGSGAGPLLPPRRLDPEERPRPNAAARK